MRAVYVPAQWILPSGLRMSAIFDRTPGGTYPQGAPPNVSY